MRTDRIAGTMFGAAIGDALGSAFEMLGNDAIERALGSAFVLNFHTARLAAPPPRAGPTNRRHGARALARLHVDLRRTARCRALREALLI
jgi:hypothetical protein